MNWLARRLAACWLRQILICVMIFECVFAWLCAVITHVFMQLCIIFVCSHQYFHVFLLGSADPHVFSYSYALYLHGPRSFSEISSIICIYFYINLRNICMVPDGCKRCPRIFPYVYMNMFVLFFMQFCVSFGGFFQMVLRIICMAPEGSAKSPATFAYCFTWLCVIFAWLPMALDQQHFQLLSLVVHVICV